MKRALPLLILLLSACHDQRPPAPTAEESDQLNQADDELDRLAANDQR